MPDYTKDIETLYQQIKDDENGNAGDSDTTDTDQADSTDTAAATCGNKVVEDGEVCDGNAEECGKIDAGYIGGYATCKTNCKGWDTTECQGTSVNPDPADSDDTTDTNHDTTDTNPDTTDTDDTTPGGDTGDTASADADPVFSMGPYTVKTTDIASDTDGAPREFRIYEPTGAVGNIPVIHFLHGFMYKIGYYDNILTHLASHGFIVVSSQSDHAMMGGDTTIVEAEKVGTFINWLKQNIQSKVSVTADVKYFGVSGHSRGGKVTNRVLNTDPAMATSFFGVDPVDSAPPLGGDSDPTSLSDPVQFKGESMFLGTELGPNGMQACAPAGENSANFYAKYPSVSHHIIAAGVGHADMVDDQSECGMYCSTCPGSGNDALNQQFITYTGGLMTAFFNATLKGMTAYETLLNDSSKHPFQTTIVEHK